MEMVHLVDMYQLFSIQQKKEIDKFLFLTLLYFLIFIYQ